jgi:translation initiation factor IF-3
LRKNQQIRVPEVLLIDDRGKKIGVVPIEKAQSLAWEREVDLVEVSPEASPPVCKLIDFGKYKYKKEKAERKQKAKQKKVEIKGIRLTLKIGKHDLEVRQKRAEKFFKQGHKVKVEMLLRGREKAHSDLAKEIINNFQAELGEDVIAEQPLTRQGAKFSVLLSKKK